LEVTICDFQFINKLIINYLLCSSFLRKLIRGLGSKFILNFQHLQKPKDFGVVESGYFNDFDYEISGNFDAGKLKINCSITRNELDLKKVKKEFNGIFRGAKKPYDLETL
jgi:hypothetical protein